MKKGGDKIAEASDNGSRDTIEQQSKWLICWTYFIKGIKRFTAFLFSHVGLTCLIVGYSLLGGIMFKAIELPKEKTVRSEAVETVNRFRDKIVEFTGTDDENAVALYRSLWDKTLVNLLKDYEQEMHRLTNEEDWDGQLGDESYQWTFANSLLYSVTIITTIGYGNVTPKTKFGRFVTIIYASLGIPLTMLYLRIIGDMMAGLFRIGYRLSCTNMTYQYIKLKRRRIKQRFMKRLQKKTQDIKHWASSKQSVVSSLLHHQHSTTSDARRKSRDSMDNPTLSPIETHRVELSDEEEPIDTGSVMDTTEDVDRRKHGRSRSHSMHYHRRSTIEQHDFRRKLSMPTSTPIIPTFERVLSTVNDLSIIPEDSTDFDLQRHVHAHNEDEDDEKISRHSSTISDLSLRDFEEDDKRLKERLKQTRDFVPISVCLLIVTGYMIGGAILFTSWEKGWDFLVGFYFCFITLSTIGLGDFVPGMVTTNMDSDGRRVLCILYLVFGMALLAMSFHLIQEEVKHKFRKIAIKCGLIEEKLTKMLDKYDY